MKKKKHNWLEHIVLGQCILSTALSIIAIGIVGYDIIMFATPRTRSATPDELEGALRSLLKRAHIQTVRNEQ